MKIICGGRDLVMAPWVTAGLTANVKPDDQIIVGGARGADSIAEEYARSIGCVVHVERAEWDKYGKAAGVIRNQRMIDLWSPDMLIAFPGGRGTADMIRRAENANMHIIRVGIDR